MIRNWYCTMALLVVVAPSARADELAPLKLTADPTIESAVSAAIEALGRYRVVTSSAAFSVEAHLGRVGDTQVVDAVIRDESRGDIIAQQSAPVTAGVDAPTVATVVVRRLFGLKADLPKPPPPVVRARVMVAPVVGGDVALTQVAAESLAEVGRFDVITQSEVKAALTQMQREYELGCPKEDCLVELGGLVEAQLVVQIVIGTPGGRHLMTASLIDIAAQAATHRTSLTLAAEQLPDGARVIVRRLFGEPAQLEALPGAEQGLNDALADVAGQIAKEVKARRQSELDQLGALPFVEAGHAAKSRQLGKTLEGLVRTRLVQGHAVSMVPDGRTSELAGRVNLDGNDRLDARKLKDVARFLGAGLVLRGVVSDLGNHFLLDTNLVDDAGNTVWRTIVALPRSPGLSDLAAKAFVRRTTSGAVFRAVVVPGWGQFYNDSPVKGAVITTGAVAGLAAVAAGLVLRQSSLQESREWDVGGDKRLDECPVVTAPCEARARELRDEADSRTTIAIGGAAVAGAFWLWGVIDAAVNAEDYSDVDLTASISRGGEPMVGIGGQW